MRNLLSSNNKRRKDFFRLLLRNATMPQSSSRIYHQMISIVWTALFLYIWNHRHKKCFFRKSYQVNTIQIVHSSVWYPLITFVARNEYIPILVEMAIFHGQTLRKWLLVKILSCLWDRYYSVMISLTLMTLDEEVWVAFLAPARSDWVEHWWRIVCCVWNVCPLSKIGLSQDWPLRITAVVPWWDNAIDVERLSVAS